MPGDLLTATCSSYQLEPVTKLSVCGTELTKLSETDSLGEQCTYARGGFFKHELLWRKIIPDEFWKNKNTQTSVCKLCLQLDSFLHELINDTDKCLKRLKRAAQNQMVKSDLEEEAKVKEMQDIIKRYNEIEKLRPKYTQAYSDISQAHQDCDEWRAFMQKEYNVPDSNISVIRNEGLSKINKEYMNLQKQMRGGPDTLIFHVYAGHGVQQGGQQNLLVNEYDARTTFYKRFKAETIIRDFSMKLPNTYHIAIFACCRELERYEYSFVSVKEASKAHTELMKELEPDDDDGEGELLKS